MKTLTQKQMKEITDIIDKHTGVLLKITIGDESNVDPLLLDKLGIPRNAPSTIDNAFVLGKLIQLLSDPAINSLTYADLKKEAEKASLSVVEKNSLEFAKTNAAKYVKGLGQKMTNNISTTINNASHQANLEIAEKNLIRDKVSQAILNQQTRGKLVSELGHELEDWRRDWQRLAHTELWNAKLQGEVITILQGSSIYSNASRGDTMVFRRPAPDACKHCKRLYLADGTNIPRIFKLRELVQNGTNVGKKVGDWLPITGTTHPNCGCPLAVIPKGFGFSDNGDLEFQGGDK